MGGRLNLACLIRSVRNSNKGLSAITSHPCMEKVQSSWVTSEKGLGVKLQFPTTATCREANELLRDSVTLIPNDKRPSSLTLVPQPSSEETLEQVLSALRENPNDNFTLLRPGARGNQAGKIMVEFASPNIAKPLHMGHLRSAVTGNYVARVHKALHCDVSSFCFLGDWGTQFGLLHAGLASWHQGASLLESTKSLDLSQLLNYYVRAVKEQETNTAFAGQARQFSASLEEGNADAVQVWRTIRDKSVSHLEGMWRELGITFDVVQGESEYIMKTEHANRAMELMESSQVIHKGPDGVQFALVQVGEKAKQETKVTLVKSDGSSLYILRDIAAAIHRREHFKFDRMIYIVDYSQANHFIALFDILRQIGINTKRREEEDNNPMYKHVSFGRVSGQSTRSGTFSLLSDVIRDGTEIMSRARASSPNTRLEDDASISKELAISSVIINSFRIRRNKNLDFNWEEALRPTGDTGVSLQYTHARLFSLLCKLGEEFCEDGDGRTELKYPINYKYILEDPIALELALQLLK